MDLGRRYVKFHNSQKLVFKKFTKISEIWSGSVTFCSSFSRDLTVLLLVSSSSSSSSSSNSNSNSSSGSSSSSSSSHK